MFKQKLWKKPALYAGIIIGAVAFSCQQETESPITGDSIEFVKFQSGDIIPGKYIVTLMPTGINFRKDLSYDAVQASMRKTGSELLTKYRIDQENLGFVYGSSIEGFAVSLTDEQYHAISKDPSIKAIEPDRVIALAPPSGKGPGGGSTPPAESIPAGITRVNGGTTTSPNVAWVIDSGIDLDHPDLNVDVIRSKSFLGGKDANDPNDGNGHGTHVAGTIAAIKGNNIGVVGVSPGSTVISVRVLDRRGSGSYSSVIAGIDYVGSNGSIGDVANMSLGGGASQALDDAVVAASTKVKFAIAAGNESDDANNHSPARAEGTNIYTISAMNSSDIFASFSNYGNPPIDYCAPGVSILSTWKDGGYNTISGTSMAAPHAAGVLLLGSLKTDGLVKNDPDGKPDLIITH